MFTSRAEFRLSLRADNADQRLTPRGIALGCVGHVRAEAFGRKMDALESGRAALRGIVLSPSEAVGHGLRVNQDGQRRDGLALLSFPDIGFDDLATIAPELASVPRPIRAQLERDALYAVYLDRQEADVAALRRDEQQAIPADFDYFALSGLSRELQGKLDRARPATLAQAARIDGMTPAALTLILARLKQRSRTQAAG